MTKVPWGADNMWIFRDMLLAPFAAIVIYKVINYFLSKLTLSKNVKISLKKGQNGKINLRSIFSLSWREIGVAALFILSISSFATAGIYNAYKHSTYMRAWTTAHEIEAARYIEEITPPNETYVVLCEATTRLAGYAVVGPQNPRAYYYGPYESRLLKSAYNKFISNPSLEPLYEVRQKNNASIIYVMVTEFRPPVDGDHQVIKQIMDLPFSELVGVFGEGVYVRGKFEGSVYVFKVRLPTERIFRGIGPRIYIYNNKTYVNTALELDIATYEANYTLQLAGLSRYNITGWPIHWSFESITPQPTVKSVDADKWINFTGAESQTYTVMWTANVLYQLVGWKDDSFKEGWRVTRFLRWKQKPQIWTDGDVLTLTGIFEKGTKDSPSREALVLTKDVANISTNDYPYVVVKWKSTSTNTWVAVVYEDELGEKEVVYILRPQAKYPWAQYSPKWKVTALRLPEGKIIKAVRIALDDYPPWSDIGGTHSAYYDYIILSNISKPQF
jgi:hypothetical protein